MNHRERREEIRVVQKKKKGDQSILIDSKSLDNAMKSKCINNNVPNDTIR